MEASRRTFMQTLAAAGVTLAAVDAVTAPAARAADSPAEEAAAKLPQLRVAIIGAGSQGRNLMQSCFKTGNALLNFVAVCDIWDYSRTYATNILKKYYKTGRYKAAGVSPEIHEYTDYRELLAKEKLDAVIVATPDWMHAEHANACLQAGVHVYCEKEMSNTIEAAASMVKAARAARKCLQIGHQRRSNPRYLHALKMIRKDRILGRITNLMGQWNRSKRLDLGWPKDEVIPAETLKKFGYDTMERFRNWRWYRQFSGGAIADLGSHQIDVFNWFLGTAPVAVEASGGLDYYKDREWYDNILALLEYKTPDGMARAFYQVINTSGYGGYYEVFMGDEGTLEISEDPRRGAIAREPDVKPKEWENEAKMVEHLGMAAIQLKIGETLSPTGKPAMEKLAAESEKPVHQLHIENFVAAVLANDPTKLSCPPEVGYETCVTVLKINEAVAGRKRIEYGAGDFSV